MKKVLVLSTAFVLANGAFAAASRVTFEKPSQRWLWGGFGFHNSEATMTPVMSDEFRDERVLKTFREIAPTYARVFAGYAAKMIELKVAHPLAKPLRVYEYDSAHPPRNAFNDLQPPKGTVTAKDGLVTIGVPARSLTFLTTDYMERTPAPVSGVKAEGGWVRWQASADPDHVYYRVYCDGRQIASTVATATRMKGNGNFTVTGVDRWGNEGK